MAGQLLAARRRERAQSPSPLAARKTGASLFTGILQPVLNFAARANIAQSSEYSLTPRAAFVVAVACVCRNGGHATRITVRLLQNAADSTRLLREMRCAGSIGVLGTVDT